MLVHELSDVVGVASPVLVAHCRALGIDAGWAGASLTDDEAARVRAAVAAGPPPAAPPAPPHPSAPIAHGGYGIPVGYPAPNGYPVPPGYPGPATYPLPTAGMAPAQLGPRCQACGSGSAARVQFESGAGMIFLHKTRRWSGVFCHGCGMKVYQKAMGSTLVTGWWGLLSLFIYNPMHIAVNLSNRRKLSRIRPR